MTYPGTRIERVRKKLSTPGLLNPFEGPSLTKELLSRLVSSSQKDGCSAYLIESLIGRILPVVHGSAPIVCGQAISVATEVGWIAGAGCRTLGFSTENSVILCDIANVTTVLCWKNFPSKFSSNISTNKEPLTAFFAVLLRSMNESWG